MAERLRPVLCLHGFLRSGLAMAPMALFLRRQGHPEALCPTIFYPSGPLEGHARRIAALAFGLQRVHGAPVDVVTHSMGGLLARAMLAEGAPLRRIVMLAPPNQGAWMADRARRLLPVHRLGFDPLAPLLPGAPAALPAGAEGVEIGILTGGTAGERGMWPWLPGDNDGRVRVEEARLPGARELRVVPFGHATIPYRPAVMRMAAAFLREGRFPTTAAAP